MQIFLNLLRPFDEHQRQHVITMENDNGHDGQDFTQGWNLKNVQTNSCYPLYSFDISRPRGNRLNFFRLIPIASEGHACGLLFIKHEKKSRYFWSSRN